MRALPFLLLLSQIGLAQVKNAPEKQQIVNTVGNGYNQGVVQTFDERYEGIKGSPFLYDQWVKGKVCMNDGRTFDGVQIMYDLYRDEIRVKRRDGAEVVPSKESIKWFALDRDSLADARRFVRIEYLKNYRKFPYNHFAEMLYEEKSTLIALYDKGLIKANYQRAYSANRPYDEFNETSISYYFISSGGRVTPLKPTPKHLRRLLQDKKDEVDEFLAQQAIKESQDLIQLIMLYDQ